MIFSGLDFHNIKRDLLESASAFSPVDYQLPKYWLSFWNKKKKTTETNPVRIFSDSSIATQITCNLIYLHQIENVNGVGVL